MENTRCFVISLLCFVGLSDTSHVYEHWFVLVSEATIVCLRGGQAFFPAFLSHRDNQLPYRYQLAKRRFITSCPCFVHHHEVDLQFPNCGSSFSPHLCRCPRPQELQCQNVEEMCQTRSAVGQASQESNSTLTSKIQVLSLTDLESERGLASVLASCAPRIHRENILRGGGHGAQLCVRNSTCQKQTSMCTCRQRNSEGYVYERGSGRPSSPFICKGLFVQLARIFRYLWPVPHSIILKFQNSSNFELGVFRRGLSGSELFLSSDSQKTACLCSEKRCEQILA